MRRAAARPFVVSVPSNCQSFLGRNPDRISIEKHSYLDSSNKNTGKPATTRKAVSLISQAIKRTRTRWCLDDPVLKRI